MNIRNLAITIALLAISNLCIGQQLIGSFPTMDGGFESQSGTLTTLTTLNSAQSSWTTSAGVGIINNTGGRSGPKYVNYTQTGTSHRRLQSPTANIPTGSYIVQFFYQGDLDGTISGDNIRGAVSSNGSSNPVYGAYINSANTGSVWTKYTAVLSPATYVANIGIGIVSVNNTAQFNIDDFIIYAGSAIDNTAPNSPGTVTISNATTSTLDISWGAASGGVDGGGYVVVRYASNPNADNDPNQNGIYAVGNTITNGTGGLTGTVRYIGSAATFTDNLGLLEGTTYYYKVYTVDKAFNYSSEMEGSGTTAATGLLTPPVLSADIIDNNVDNNIDISFTDNSSWRAAILSVKAEGVTLTPTTDYLLTAGNLQLKPSGLNAILTTSGSKSIVIEATGYTNATVSQLINPGTATKLVLKTQPTAPLLNAAVLATQPAVYIQDQYGNITPNTDNVTATVNNGTWILGGTTTIAAISGTATFTNLTASSTTSVNAANIIFTSGTLSSVISNSFDIPAPGAVLTVTPTTLTGFTYTVGSGPSASQSFDVSGSNLTGNINISAPTNYEISLTNTTGYTISLSLIPTSGSIATTTIYVRLKSDLLATNYNNEVINITSVTAISKTVTVSGTVNCVSPVFPFYENFNYTTGTDLTANCWNVTGTNATPTVKVGSSPLTYSGYLSSGIGKEAILSSAGGQDVNKTFIPQTSGTIYTSFLVNVTSATLNGDYFFHLGQASIGNTFRGRIYVKKDASNNLAFGIAHSTTTVNYSSFSYSLNTTYLVVLKFDIISGTLNDVSSIYINPTLNAPIPSSGWLANTDASGTDLTDIGSVALRQGGSSSAPDLSVSGIRVSNNWEDIVGPLLTEPTNHATLFTATANSTSTITNTWNDNDGSQAASGFLILVNTSGNFIDPVDGVSQSDDIDLSDGVGAINVNHGVQTYTWNNLSAGVHYFFKIYPFNGSGAAINYKTNDIIPTADATTQIITNKTLNLTLLLEGLFNGTNMNAANDDIGAHWGSNIADQITVELHNSTNYITEATFSNQNLNTDGSCIVNIPAAYGDLYYIVIKHRNSIQTWSSNPISFSNSTINYNFKTSASSAYGDNLKQVATGVYAIYVGDVNQDEVVDLSDLVDMDNDLINGTVSYIVYDLNGDGVVDLSDLVAIDENLTNGIVSIYP